jgi:hypothetical protein
MPQPASRFALFFGTETRPDAAQRLRFGCYQLWQGEHRRERGIFYDPDNLQPSELDELTQVAKSRGHRLMTAAEFVDLKFYPSAKAGATIVGFNLPSIFHGWRSITTLRVLSEGRTAPWTAQCRAG